jgi:penicillin-binding protein 1A
MMSVRPQLEAARAFALDRGRRLVGVIRRHPYRAALVLPVLGVLYVLALIPFTPGVDHLRKAKSATPSTVLSADGVVLAEFKRINREWVPLERISPHVVDALIAVEDRRFYDHHGIDFKRTAAAAFRTLQGDLQGGSTITQQLARNLYPEEIGRATNINRKLKEAITALKIEAVYTKREILETYLNTVPFLYNAFGIEMAARTYFDSSAQELDVLEAATLVGMLKATSAFNPVLHPERAVQRRNLVLAQMAKQGKLTPAQLASLTKRPLRLDFERQTEQPGPAPHLAQAIRRWLIAWADERDVNIYTDGLVVHTTLDSRLQQAANDAVTKQLAALQSQADRGARRGNSGGESAHALQAGFMAMDPRNGYIRAWVGSRDFATEQFDHVSQARRQPGSAFKPFVYGAAFMTGMRPSTTFVDEPVTIRLSANDVWSPTDATPPSYEPMTLRDGLAYSKNTITAQVMQKVGPERVVQLAQALGVRDSKLDPVPSLALGTSPVTLREMVSAYGALANGGRYVEPMFVSSVADREGNVLVRFQSIPEAGEAMPRSLAMELVNVMRGVIDVGTGTAVRERYGITADVAGKTGTTQENTDGWFLMMHPQLVAGARVGFNDTMTMGAWGQGARSALPMVATVFQQALRNKWIDQRVEFDIPRPRPAPRREPEREAQWARPDEIFSGVMRELRRMFR